MDLNAVDVESELAEVQQVFIQMDQQLMQTIAQAEVIRMNLTQLVIRRNDLLNRLHTLNGGRKIHTLAEIRG